MKEEDVDERSNLAGLSVYFPPPTVRVLLSFRAHTGRGRSLADFPVSFDRQNRRGTPQEGGKKQK